MPAPSPMIPPLTPRTAWRTAAATAAVAAVAAAFWLAIAFYQIILVFFLAVLLNTAFEPAIRRLTERRVSRLWATVFVYGLICLLILVVLLLTVPLISTQSTVIWAAWTELLGELQTGLAASDNPLFRRLGESIPAALTAFANPPAGAAEEAADPLSPAALTYISLATRAFFTTVLVFVLAFYWSIESGRISQMILLLIPLERRPLVRSIAAEIEQKVGAYVLGQGLLCLIIGGLSFLLYLAIGLPYAFLLALIAGITEAIPTIGPVLGAVPAVLVALTGDPVDALWVLGGAAVIQLLENNLLVPRVMARAVGVRPLVTLLAILLFGALFGVVGALLAIPLSAVIEILMNRLLAQSEAIDWQNGGGRSQVSVLRYQAREIARDVRRQVREERPHPATREEPVEDALEAIALDVEALLAGYGAGEGRP